MKRACLPLTLLAACTLPPAPATPVVAPDPLRDVALDVTLENGLRVVVVQRPELPLVTFSLYLRGGLLLDTARTFRHGSLALGCLWMGCGDRDEDAMREALADAGAECGSYVDLQDARVHLSCLSSHAELGLSLLADALLRPTFPPEVVAREREQERRDLAQRGKRPEYLAQEAFVRALVGDHPLAQVFALHDTENALAAADRDALVAAWQRMLQPQLGTLFVVGRVDQPLIDAVRARLLAWPRPQSPTTIDVAPPAAQPVTSVIKVPLPEMTQVYLQFGMLGPAPTDAMAPAIHVLRLAMAGGFTSALEDELRVDRALVYDISFTHPTLTFTPPYSLTTQTSPDKVREVLDVSMQLLRAATGDGLSDAQVEAARNMWLGTRALERETQLGVADALNRGARLFGDFAQPAREAAAVRATTLAQVAAAAARFDPARFVVVMVGAPDDLAKIDWPAGK